MVSKKVTLIPILGGRQAKGKLIEKIGEDHIGDLREGGRFSLKNYTHENEKGKHGSLRFLLLEVSHKDGFKKMREELYKSVKAGLAVFSFPERDSLVKLPEYVRELQEFSKNEISLLLIGHSVNLIKKGPDEVSLDMIEEYRDKIKKEVGAEHFRYNEVPSYHKDFEDDWAFLAKEVLEKEEST